MSNKNVRYWWDKWDLFDGAGIIEVVILFLDELELKIAIYNGIGEEHMNIKS